MELVKLEGLKTYLNTIAYLRKEKRPKKRARIIVNVIPKVLYTIKPTTIISADIEELTKISAIGVTGIEKSLKSENLSKGLRKMVLPLLRSYGMIEIFKVANRTKIVLTALGDIVSTFIKESKLSDTEKLSLILIAGMLFKTKARVLTLSILSGNSNLRDVYNAVSARFFRGDLKGVEKVAFEILDEIRCVSAGIVKEYASQTQIALHGLSYVGLITLSSLNEFSINSSGNFITPADFLGLDFEMSKGLHMGFSIDRERLGYTPIDEIERKYGNYGKELVRLINALKANKSSIEINLEKFFALPFSY